MKSSLTLWIITNHCPFLLIQAQHLSFSECLLRSYNLYKLGTQRWTRLLPKGFGLVQTGLWPGEDTAWHYSMPGVQHVCVTLGCSTFPFSRSLVLALIMHRRKQHFVHSLAFNRLIIFGISIPPKVYKPKSSCVHLGWPAARKWEQLFCPNWTEGSWLALDGDCLDHYFQGDAERASVHLR